MDKSPEAFRTISEVAEVLETPAHVLRFWESRFPQIRPVKRAGGRRYYRPADVALLAGIKHLLHDQGLTIRGVQKILRESGVRAVAEMAGVDLPADSPEDAEAALEAALSQSFGYEFEPGPASPDPEGATIIALESALRGAPSQSDPEDGDSQERAGLANLFAMAQDAAPPPAAPEPSPDAAPEAAEMLIPPPPEGAITDIFSFANAQTTGADASEDELPPALAAHGQTESESEIESQTGPAPAARPDGPPLDLSHGPAGPRRESLIPLAQRLRRLPRGAFATQASAATQFLARLQALQDRLSPRSTTAQN